MLALSVTEPPARLVGALNAFQPEVMNAYPSLAAVLAEEQLSGRGRGVPRPSR